jgi:hypothetical protein
MRGAPEPVSDLSKKLDVLVSHLSTGANGMLLKE